ncbi:hypothetical protein CLOSYM_04819 [[Clostridium] symbiosum ATCC 14940]|uniref:Uncharacterized protein n=1 Tax=[Clostridium] symbiosum ATCC 14940 TaxID=411472 RepID=A0ABC9TQS1_CLOSY|nr:hypothetical protein CLOSYM_04819 [[Clostridium] symbiosum ATCC 14940]
MFFNGKSPIIVGDILCLRQKYVTVCGTIKVWKAINGNRNILMTKGV